MISMNEPYADNLENCTKNVPGNNYICNRSDLAVLEF